LTSAFECGLPDDGDWALDTQCWNLVTGCSILEPGYWTIRSTELIGVNILIPFQMQQAIGQLSTIVQYLQSDQVGSNLFDFSTLKIK
jgi:hypothetical protein